MCPRARQSGVWPGLSAALVLVLALATSCDSGTTTPIPTFLVVSPDSIFLYRGDSVQLTVGVLDKDSALITGTPVSFTSSDTTLVKVSVLGLVRSRGPVGTASIHVVGGGLQKVLPVTVQGRPIAIIASPADTTIRQGGSYQLRVNVIDSLGDTVPGQSIAYESQNTAIVNVSLTGEVTTGSLAGLTSIRVSSGALNTSANVTVTDTNLLAHVFLGNDPYGVAAAANGVVFVTAINGPAVRRLDMTSFTLTDTIPVGGQPVQVAFNGAGDTAYVLKQFGAVGIISVAKHVQVDSIIVPSNCWSFIVSSDGATGYVAAGRLYKLNMTTRTVVDSARVPTGLDLAFGPGDSLLYVSSPGGTVTEVRAATLATVRTFMVGGVPVGLRVAPDGTELYIADGARLLHIWSLTSGTEVGRIQTGFDLFGVALTPDGTKLYVTSVYGGYVLVVNRVTRAIIRTIVVGGRLRFVAVDPITGYAVVANQDGWIDVVR